MASSKDSSTRIVGESPGQKKVTVYLLWHTDRFGDEKLIGVYQRESDASSAIKRVQDKPGFSEEGGAFEIVVYEINKDHWTEGFIRSDGFSLPSWFRPNDST